MWALGAGYNRPVPFLGQMSQEPSKPGLDELVWLSVFTVDMDITLDFSVFFFRFWLSALLQLIAWKDSSPT